LQSHFALPFAITFLDPFPFTSSITNQKHMAAEAVLSAFLQSLFDGMASPEFADFFRQRKLNEGVLEKLKIALLSVQKLREDAEDKQLADRSVGDWLHKLKDVVYDAEDVLDEIATEALQRKLDAEFQTTASKVQNSISTFLSHFVKEIGQKMQEILAKLEYLAKKKDFLGLKEGGGGKPERWPTTSLVEESGIFGRDDDKEKIINLLLSNKRNAWLYTLIPLLSHFRLCRPIMLLKK
jgi:hypothetical protein